MGSFSDFLELELLDHIFGAAAYTAPATLYVGLFTATPSDAGGGTEVATGSYARVAVTNNAANFPAAAAGSKSNGTVITFPMATASWGTITSFGIFTAATAGTLLAWGALTTSRAVANLDVLYFPVGQLVITLD
jgi:hypothetical protein